MSKRTVRLTESELKNIITESVKKILKEYTFEFNPDGCYEIEIDPVDWADNIYVNIPIPDDSDIWDELWELLPSVWIEVDYEDGCIESIKIENQDEIEKAFKYYLTPQDISNVVNNIISWLESDDEYLDDRLKSQISDRYDSAEADYYDFLGNGHRE